MRCESSIIISMRFSNKVLRHLSPPVCLVEPQIRPNCLLLHHFILSDAQAKPELQNCYDAVDLIGNCCDAIGTLISAA